MLTEELTPERVSPGLIGLVLLLVPLALLVVLIVGVVVLAKANKRRKTRASNFDTPSPPGWYPLADGSGRVAWWDGARWNEGPPAVEDPP